MSTHHPGPVALDAHTFIGAYPFRHIPHPDADALLRVLDREAVAHAWVGYLPAPFHRDPAHANSELYTAIGPHRDRLSAAPAIRPDWPGWLDEFHRAVAEGAAAIRAYPVHWGLASGSTEIEDLAGACGGAGLPLLLTVRFEDSRQRHPFDVTPDLDADRIRALARAGTGARVVVLGAGRHQIEEVHWGLTEAERANVWWDISWIWGPPEEDLAHLFRTVGADRFVYGSGWPLRLAQTPRANLALLPGSLSSAAMADPARWRR